MAEVWRWNGMARKRKQKNPHAVALGRLGGLVRSEAKKRASKKNGRKGGLVKSRKKTIAVRLNARQPRPGRRDPSARAGSLPAG